jgi:hypothetical protein
MMIDSLLRYYSHAYYRNGFRRDPPPVNPDILTFETGFYGLEFNINDLSTVWFQQFSALDPISYERCFLVNRTDSFEKMLLKMEIFKEGVAYSCTNMAPPVDVTKPFNATVILWEAGKIAQRFELCGLIFKDSQGNKLAGAFSLTFLVWPDAFALTLTAKKATGKMEVTLRLKDWVAQQCFEGEFDLTLPCNINKRATDASLKVTTDAIQLNLPASTTMITLPTRFQPYLHAYETTVEYWYIAQPGRLGRKFNSGYIDIRDYDDYHIVLQEGTTSPTPYVLSLGMPANVTGMCPMLLTKDGIPTGIPVQLSKNWHWAEKGAYAKLYMILPASGTYILRVTYGFYGTLPAASHAQLSLWGYGTVSPTGRWDQLAIGCWGETFCIDSEFSCGVEGQITDVRGLMMGSQPEQKWNWSHCAWGGDWLRAYNPSDNKRIYVNNVKVAYLSHGPCLTNVRFYGYYGDGAVKFQVGIRTLRTDDYCRTFLQFDYLVQKDISLKNGYLHNMLQRAFHTPTVAHGNSQGLLQERTIPDGLKANQVHVKNQSFEGAAPFWIAFPRSDQFPPNDPNKKQMPSGTKNMIVHAFSASVGGKCYSQPAFSLVNEITCWARQNDKSSLMANLELPNGIQEMRAGDSVQMEIEWTTHSRQASDYYGPNQGYKSFLSLNPNSWKIPFREAQLNGSLLKVEVAKEGGELVHKYPITVKVTNDEGVTLTVYAGVGAMPMEFCGLKHSDYRLYSVSQESGEDAMLDQSSKVGNDYWQTDYDFSTKTYTMTFNPMLGDVGTTKWKLKKFRK